MLLKITLCLLLFAASRAEYVTVKINNGFIRGEKNFTVGKGLPYYNFRGIPYAEPPTNNLRLKSPVPKSNWDGILDTFSDKDACVQGSPTTGSEDCLYVNVYTPTLADNCASLPTMIWVLGGAFLEGNATYEVYGPDYLLENEIVVVTFSYRLGVFGFSSTNDGVLPGNLGFKDQLLVLEWVRDNIKSFCGNPSQVTLAGSSAGAASVSYHLQSPRSQGLFHRAIIESGSSLDPWALSLKASDIIKTVGEKLGLDTSNSESLVEGLRSADVGSLQEAAAAVSSQFLLSDFSSFAPVSEVASNDTFFTGSSYNKLSRGDFNKVPLLVGYNSLEAYIEVTAATRLFFAQFDLIPTKVIPPNMAVSVWNALIAAGRIKFEYFGLAPISLTSYDLLKFLTDFLFVNGIVDLADLAKEHTSVHFYEFTYVGGLAGFYNRTYQGVRHAEEICYYWRCYNEPASDHDLVVRDRMVKLWSNFIKEGNPTPIADRELNNVTWTTLDQGKSYLEIGSDLVMKTEPNKKYADFWSDMYEDYGRKTF